MLYYCFAMKGNNTTRKLLIFVAALAVLFVAVTAITASKTLNEAKANESFTEIDYYSMQEYSDQNVESIMKALKSGSSENLSKLITASDTKDGVDAVLEFADWSNADIENAVGLGAGSLSPEPDANGRMDVSERFFVYAGDSKYVLFIETLTSRWGRNNDGVSAVSVMTFEHFDALDYGWNGEADDYSAVAGSLFWTGNQPEDEGAE